MKTTTAFLCMLAIAALATWFAVRQKQARPAMPQAQPADASLAWGTSPPPAPVAERPAPEAVPAPSSNSPSASRSHARPAPAEEPASVTNKLERLAQIRESFRALAAGEPVGALRAARQLTDETERETALLTLVTEWTRGQLSPPRERARWVAVLGLEAGLGMELIKNPELGVVWANELTEGFGRSTLLQRIAVAMADTDPAAGLTLSAQVPEDERRSFSAAVYAGWAANDTAAALQWVGQLSDPAEREAALQAVHSVAPVGIGAELRVQDGAAIINRVLAGTPAELSGQLHPGDRIVALAQGDNAFVDAGNLPLAEIVKLIRGAPGTTLQLQVLPADATPNSPPRTISIVRDQIKFKR